jgi:hypothetical protein
MVRLPTDAVATAATGVSRTVTVEDLLMLSSYAAGSPKNYLRRPEHKP